MIAALAVLGGCEPTKEDTLYINTRQLLLSARAERLPDRTTILTTSAICKKAQQDRGRSRAARKLADECEPPPEVWYYQKALAAFPEALTGASDQLLPARLRQACDAANSTLRPFPPQGTPKDRDRLPEARQLAEECDRSIEKLTKP